MRIPNGDDDTAFLVRKSELCVMSGTAAFVIGFFSGFIVGVFGILIESGNMEPDFEFSTCYTISREPSAGRCIRKRRYKVAPRVLYQVFNEIYKF